MHLPWSVIASTKLVRAGCFFGQFPPGSLNDHLCVIVNNPDIADDGSIVYYVHFTSQVTKRKIVYRNDRLALVEFAAHEMSSHFTVANSKDCVVGCGFSDINQTTIGTLKKLYASRLVEIKSDGCSRISELVQAVRSSASMNTYQKEMFLA